MSTRKVVVYDAVNVPPSAPSEIHCTAEEGRTIQGAADQTDLNVMLRRLGPGGGLPVFGGRDPFYGDVSEVGDYRNSLEVVMRGEDAFMSQPAEVRTRFANDPAEFLEFVMNPANKDEAVKLGLIAAPVAPVPPVIPSS